MCYVCVWMGGGGGKGATWGETLPLQPRFPGSGVPKRTRGLKQRGIDFWTFVGSVHQIDLREQKEDTGSKITKIDITFNAFFCWIRAPLDAQIRRRSKIRCPVVWVHESLWAHRMLEVRDGGGGLRPILPSMRFFAGFELDPMHRSDEGPKH